MVDHFLKLLQGGQTPQRQLAEAMQTLVLPMVTAAAAEKQAVFSPENIKFLVTEVFNPGNSANLAGVSQITCST